MSESEYKVIHVEFFDAETGERFAQADLPAEQLPLTFENSTSLDLDDQEWIIIRAEPPHAEEFRRNGSLQLFLRKVPSEKVDPNNLLFSLATICDPLPIIDEKTSKTDRSTLELHEDDWRQVELTSDSVQDLVEEELEFVRKVYEQHYAGVGFKELHVRSRMNKPLNGAAIRVSELRKIFDRATWLDGISFLDANGTVQHGYAARLLCSVEIYGTHNNDVVQCLCIQNRRANNVPDTELRALCDIAENQQLHLIDWRRAQKIPTHPVRFLDYFKKP